MFHVKPRPQDADKLALRPDGAETALFHKLSGTWRSEDQTIGVSRETCTPPANECLFHVEQAELEGISFMFHVE